MDSGPHIGIVFLRLYLSFSFPVQIQTIGDINQHVNHVIL